MESCSAPKTCPCEAALALADAATDVLLTWDAGDLADAIRGLGAALTDFNMAYPPPSPSGSTSHPGPAGFPPGTRFREALSVIRPGVSNFTGIVHALLDASRQALYEHREPAQDPAVRLLARHVGWICQLDDEDGSLESLIAECNDRLRSLGAGLQ